MKKTPEQKKFSRREKIFAWIMIGIMLFGIVAGSLSFIISTHVH